MPYSASRDYFWFGRGTGKTFGSLRRGGAPSRDLSPLVVHRHTDDLSDVRRWLLRRAEVVQRVRTDAFRRRKRRPETVELVDEGPATPPPQDALASGREDLERALAALPEAFRTAVVLRDVQELSYAEIASALGVPVGTVMSRIHRGRSLLREALTRRMS